MEVKKHPYNAALFDLDGTLTDSGEGIINTALSVFRTIGHPEPSMEEMRKFVGPPLASTFRLFGVKEEQIEEAIRLYRDLYDNHGGIYENYVYPGIEELLKKLKNEKIGLYVATSKPEPVAKQVLIHFGLADYFDCIAGSDRKTGRDTKADVIRYLSAVTDGLDRVVMVGDTKFDVEGANTFRIPCIGVSWGYGTREEMVKEGAIAIVDSTEELYELLV